MFFFVKLQLVVIGCGFDNNIQNTLCVGQPKIKVAFLLRKVLPKTVTPEREPTVFGTTRRLSPKYRALIMPLRRLAK